MPSPLLHRWSIANNYLAGLTLDRWLELLGDNHVSPAYWHRAVFVSALATLNSIAALRERSLDEGVRATPIEQPPLFILGHWRSGTTHLHNLLARDRQFSFANTYQVTNPLTFLTTEEVNSRRFARFLGKKRPMDNVAMGFGEPQEDEFAPCLASLRSLYLGISFPQNVDRYDRYLTFEGTPPSEVREWQEAFLWFCRKLTFKHGNRPLLLKSPPHTARIRILLELFPDARFIHIHRHPHDVFRSTRHYWDTAVWYTYLQKPDRSQVDEQIIRRYRALFDAFHAQRGLIPDNRIHELSFQELESDPVGALQRTYESLDLPGFANFRPDLESYLGSLDGYRKNRFQPLDPALVERLGHEWKPEFDLWNYNQEQAARP